MHIQLFKYLKFLLKSTNEHGVHSPFVFNYLTKCLYKKSRISTDKALDILLKSIPYFNFKNIKVIGNIVYENQVKKHFPNLTFDPTKTDILFFESTAYIKPKKLFLDYKLDNDSFIIFNNINKNSKEQRNWLNFIASKKVSVSIDLYYCGILFIRKEQQKEHFFIRI